MHKASERWITRFVENNGKRGKSTRALRKSTSTSQIHFYVDLDLHPIYIHIGNVHLPLHRISTLHCHFQEDISDLNSVLSFARPARMSFAHVHMRTLH